MASRPNWVQEISNKHRKPTSMENPEFVYPTTPGARTEPAGSCIRSVSSRVWCVFITFVDYAYKNYTSPRSQPSCCSSQLRPLQKAPVHNGASSGNCRHFHYKSITISICRAFA
ncbi:uncharacterized protein [Drosophila bipectinata]|uniref:uncharacterized protein isoform X2 n=1 Tax=Drosophila bipectinata TaxID=42026 RepID=UPI0038B2B314